MKTYPLTIVALLIAFVCHSQPTPLPPPVLPPSGASPVIAKDAANYLIRVEWKEPKGDAKYLEMLTTERRFDLDTIQKTSVRINNNDIPVTLKFSGTLTALSDEKGRLQLFLGRTVPHVAGSYGNGPNATSSYSQLSVGLNSTFIVNFGKPVVIQNDESGQISILVNASEIESGRPQRAVAIEAHRSNTDEKNSENPCASVAETFASLAPRQLKTLDLER